MKVKGRTLEEIKAVMLVLFKQYLDNEIQPTELAKQLKSLDLMARGKSLWFKFSPDAHTAITINDIEKALTINSYARGFGAQEAKAEREKMVRYIKKAVKTQHFILNYS
jgi:hypothetical protein